MDAFVKKLVDKATKKPDGNSESLKPEDVSPNVTFHYGIPPRSNMFAFEPSQKILATSTKDGLIKLFGKDNSQALLQSEETVPSKFLQFAYNQGILFNVTATNQIEVWNVDRKILTCAYKFNEEITSFSVLQHSPFIYVGDSGGNVTVLKYNRESCDVERMKYNIPLSASREKSSGDASNNALMHILPQPAAGSKRLLLVFVDGFIALWDIRQNKPVFSTWGTIVQSIGHETKKLTSASWACPLGSKVAIGYLSGEIQLYNIPSSASDHADLTTDKDSTNMQNAHFFKLNLGFKSEKIPIASFKWAYGDGKTSRLYVLGHSASSASNSVQVVLLNDQTESRTIKLGLHLPEPCIAMEIISGFCAEQQTKNNKDGILLLLGESGHIYAYDDHSIEKYLLQAQSKSPPSNPSEVKLNLPFSDDPSITCAQIIPNKSSLSSFSDEGHLSVTKNISFLSLGRNQPDTNSFSGFTTVKNLYITGHGDGMIKFWNASYPIFVPLFSLKEQSENDTSSSGVAVTAVLYETESRLLVAGDQSGMVRIYKFKPEPYSRDNGFTFLPGSSKKESQHHFVQSAKTVKVNGSVLSLTINSSSKQLAVGSEKGQVSVIDTDEATIVYQKDIASEVSPGIVSLQFGSCNIQGFEKNILALTTKDSSVVALETDTGNVLGPNKVQPKKPFKALFLQIVDGQGENRGSTQQPDQSENDKQHLLLCSEKAAYVYSLKHVTQGVKKVHYKEKFDDSPCCWASTFFSSSGLGLLLLFTCGKIEIRSIPDLSLVKETKLRGFMYSPSKISSNPNGCICSSTDGELIVSRSDQEVTSISILPQKELYRDVDSFSRVYDKNLVGTYDEFASASLNHKDKQKGIFGFPLLGKKAQNGSDGGPEDVKASFEELTTVFSNSNVVAGSETAADNAPSNEEDELDIDDIEIEDSVKKPKGFNVMTSLNKDKLKSKFNSFKGKFKQMKGKQEKAQLLQKEPEQEKPGETGSVDQIKKKYGFASSTTQETTGLAKMMQGKLAENLIKLQGIAQRSSEMQDNAKSFSSNANELLEAVERSNKLR